MKTFNVTGCDSFENTASTPNRKMKTKLFIKTLLLLFVCFNAWAGNGHSPAHRECAHHKIVDNSPSYNPPVCDSNTMSSFAGMSATALYNYMLTVDNHECFETKIFGYNSLHTNTLFDEQKVEDILSLVLTNYNDISGDLYGVFQYLSILVVRNFEEGLFISDDAWTDIETLCSQVAANPDILNPTTKDSYLIASRLFNTCWGNNIPNNSNILNLAQTYLEQMALGNWQNTPDNHAYYISYNYLFDGLLSYAINNNAINEPAFQNTPFYQTPAFYTNLNTYNGVIASLANIACDTPLGNATYSNFRVFPTFAAKQLNLIAKKTAIDNTETLYSNYLEAALIQIQDSNSGCVPYLSGPWVYAVEGLLLNDTNLPYDIEQVLDTLDETLFPDKHIFEDGNLLIHANGIPYQEILSLYEGIQQTKAQFFRLFELDENDPVDNDPNEKVQIRIYENQDAYTIYNGFLYSSISPGGGVYIEDANTINEDRATIYTWDRDVSADESSYELEELVRHEYTHYLQGRFLVKGMWGTVNNFYNNKRLKWFEEGMAELFAGGTDTAGIIDRNVVKDNLANKAFVELENLINEGTDEYNHGAVIWLYLYNNDRELFKTLAQLTRQGDPGIAGFDSEMTALETNHEIGYEDYVDDLKAGLIPTWTPDTPSLLYNQMNVADANTLRNDLVARVSNLNSVTATEVYTFAPRRFHIQGTYYPTNGNTNEQDVLNAYSKLDEILAEIQSESPYNNFDYATAYYSDVVTGNNPSATFHIVGPLAGGVICEDNDDDNICGAIDCNDNDPTLPTTPGTVCGGVQNNIIQSDGCTCEFGYCIPSINASAENYISNVIVNGESNPSGNDDGYRDFTDIGAIDLEVSRDYQIDLHKTALPGEKFYWRVWIDYNQDGIFEDDPNTELVLEKSDQSGDIYSANFVVPQDALMGTTRMRVYLKEYIVDAPTPCATDDIYARDVEDYAINIVPNTSGPSYCEPSGQHASIYISNVSLEQINNSTGVDGYGDYTQLSANLTQSQTYTLSLGETTVWNYHWRAWIDYNQDGTFEASEQILATDNEVSNTVSQSFTIPDDALNGATRMRVYLKYYNGTPPSPCDDISLGEVEDYTINIGSNSSIIGEVGSITFNQPNANQWTTVALNNTYTSAVVIMGPVSFAGANPTTMNVRNVTSTSFECQLDEWDYLDGGHLTETVSYIVVEEGVYTLLNGNKLIAGNISLNNHGWTPMGYPQVGFTAPPLVMTQNCGSNNNHTSAVTTRVRNIGAADCQIRLQEEEGNDQTHSSGRVAFLALETGTHDGTIKFEASKSTRSVNHNWYELGFGQTYNNPIFLAKSQSFYGNDPTVLRYRNLDGNSAQVKCEEEQSATTEMTHVNEIIGWMVFDGPGNITATTTNNNLIADDTSTETPSEMKADEDIGLSVHNYPNPFSEQTTIEYTLMEDSFVTLTVSDLTGKQVAVLVDGEQQATGTHTAKFDGSRYPASMYYYTIRAGEYVGTHKMILTK